MSCAKTAEPIDSPFGLWTQVGRSKHKFKRNHQVVPMCQTSDDIAVSSAKIAKPIDLLSRLWTRVGRRKHKFHRIRKVAPMCSHGMAHLRHLANTIEPSVCGGDAALCKITLTTCVFMGHAVDEIDELLLQISRTRVVRTGRNLAA